MLRSEMITILQKQIAESGDGDIIIKTRDNFGDKCYEAILKSYIKVDDVGDTIINLYD